MYDCSCSGAAVPEQVLSGVGDGFSGGGPSAHVGDPPQSVDGVIFGLVIVKAKL